MSMLKHLVVVLALVVAACGGDADSPETSAATRAEDVASAASTTDSAPAEECAHVVDASIERNGDTFTIDATVLSADTGWDKYADAWQVWGPDHEVLAERVLAHPHETEQPFTRSLSGVQLPAGITEVTIAARDLVAGFCGDVFKVEVPSS